jgi:hypothetical protein
LDRYSAVVPCLLGHLVDGRKRRRLIPFHNITANIMIKPVSTGYSLLLPDKKGK